MGNWNQLELPPNRFRQNFIILTQNHQVCRTVDVSYLPLYMLHKLCLRWAANIGRCPRKQSKPRWHPFFDISSQQNDIRWPTVQKNSKSPSGQTHLDRIATALRLDKTLSPTHENGEVARFSCLCTVKGECTLAYALLLCFSVDDTGCETTVPDPFSLFFLFILFTFFIHIYIYKPVRGML